jgi:hypothetical protein
MLAVICKFILVHFIKFKVEQHVSAIGEMQESLPSTDQTGS